MNAERLPWVLSIALAMNRKRFNSFKLVVGLAMSGKLVTLDEEAPAPQICWIS
ncbi:MAG: hypothetical protein IPK23_09400 [Rhizobiales bacterium]|nr:hypothetical protein [Hyphomicrobiales bacterium]